MKLLNSCLVGIVLFTYVQFGSFSPAQRKNERRLKGGLSKIQLEVLRDFLALQDHKNVARLVSGHVRHKMDHDYSTAGEMIESVQSEQPVREHHAAIEKRQPLDFGTFSRTGKRRSYLKKNSAKNDEQEPELHNQLTKDSENQEKAVHAKSRVLSNKVNDFRTELGRKEDERSSELKDDDTNERDVIAVDLDKESDEQVPKNLHKKGLKSKSMQPVSVPGFPASIKGFDSKSGELYDWEED